VNGYQVLVIGGYGFFGRRLVQRLAHQPDLHVQVAGRSAAEARRLVDLLRPRARACLSSLALDTASAAWPQDLCQLAPRVVVHTAGPFQGQDYRVAQACIAAGAHYIDLADARAFVTGIGSLDTLAAAAGVAVTSGASSVPALSGAVADHLARGLDPVSFIDIGISPGNRTERGLSTIQAILSYCGQPLPECVHPAPEYRGHPPCGSQPPWGGPAPADTGRGPSFGWLGSHRHAYPAPVGSRLLSPCDVPDLALLPARFAGTPSVRFSAGLELAFLHRGMNTMAWMTRLGLVADWSAHAGWLKRAADWFKTWGSEAGAMHVSVAGRTSAGTQATRTWHLVATQGDGPYVPTLAAAALVRKFAAGELPFVGARPCLGVLTLEDFEREAQGLNIRMAEESP